MAIKAVVLEYLASKVEGFLILSANENNEGNGISRVALNNVLENVSVRIEERNHTGLEEAGGIEKDVGNVLGINSESLAEELSNDTAVLTANERYRAITLFILYTDFVILRTAPV